MQPVTSMRSAATLAMLALVAAGCYPVKSPTSGSTRPSPESATRNSTDPADAAASSADGTKEEKGKAEKERKDGRKKNGKAKQPAGRTAGAGHLSEGNVVAMMLASNNADISYARIALAQAQSARVRTFARRMITDFTSINERAMNLVRDDEGIDLEDNGRSLDLRESSAARREQLRKLRGASLDAAYINGEISYQKTMLAQIDEILLPAARGEELQKLLASLRPIIESHLAQARQIGAAMDPGEKVAR